MSTPEPPEPQRGATAAERGPDVSEPEAEALAAESFGKRLRASASPKFLLSQADGYPVVVKQFLQFCLIIIYPAWLFFLLVSAVFYGLLLALFWPVRAWMKKNRPDDYAASQLK